MYIKVLDVISTLGWMKAKDYSRFLLSILYILNENGSDGGRDGGHDGGSSIFKLST